MSHFNKALEKKVNAGTGRKLSRKEQMYKTRNWPKGEKVTKETHRKLSSPDR